MRYKDVIYLQLKEWGYSLAMRCAIMSNIQWESNYNPANLEGVAEKKLQLGDLEYQSKVDLRQYKNFANDGYGFGLCQWTWHTRKEALWKMCEEWKCSIGNIWLQLEFMKKELSTNYSEWFSTWKQRDDNLSNCCFMAEQFCRYYEAPPDVEERVKERRKTAQDLYNYYKQKGE